MTTPEQRPPAEPGQEVDRPSSAGRQRIVTAAISHNRGWKSMVEVVLERSGRSSEARQESIGEEIVLLRCAAETTLAAIHGLLGEPERFVLVGVKRVLAFDSAVILACIRTRDEHPQRLIGCVPVGENPVLAVAHAILHATNRIIESLPNAGEPPPTT